MLTRIPAPMMQSTSRIKAAPPAFTISLELERDLVGCGAVGAGAGIPVALSSVRGVLGDPSGGVSVESGRPHSPQNRSSSL
jgi:hypothetical protein